jgi:hypothetical protein
VLLAVGGAEEFVLQRAVKALHHPVGVCRVDLTGVVLDLLHETVELEGMVQRPATLHAPVIGEDPLKCGNLRLRESLAQCWLAAADGDDAENGGELVQDEALKLLDPEV